MFADLLKKLRAEKGVTQTDLAAAIQVSNGNVGDWERGRVKPGYDALVALSRFFEVSADYLLELVTAQTNDDTYMLALKEPAAEDDDTYLDIGPSMPIFPEDGQPQGGAAPEAVKPPRLDGRPLTELEMDLLAMYRLLPESSKEEIFDLVYYRYKRAVEMKKDSIYSTYSNERLNQKDGPASSGNPTSGTA